MAAALCLSMVFPLLAQTAVIPGNLQGFPFRDETLNYSVRFSTGVSLGEAQTTAKRDTTNGWNFKFSLDASLPGFAMLDRFNTYTASDLCSLRFDRTSEHGRRKVKEITYFDRGRSVAIRSTSGAGGLSETPTGLCPRDALTFLYFLRRELGQGRVPPNDTVFAGAAYHVSMTYVGEKKVERNKQQVPADQVNCTIKGPASETHLEILFARDAARTPLVIRCPFAAGTFYLELDR